MGENFLMKLNEIKRKFPSVFEGCLGKCTKRKAHVELKEDAKPTFMKARPVSFSRRQALKEELECLEKEGVLSERVVYSDWAVPIVIVSKGNGKVRVCGDFVQVNQKSHTQRYPIPHLDDLLSKIQGGMFFTTLDMSDAYFQVELDDETKKICVINTMHGLWKYSRLCFGLASSQLFSKVLWTRW